MKNPNALCFYSGRLRYNNVKINLKKNIVFNENSFLFFFFFLEKHRKLQRKLINWTSVTYDVQVTKVNASDARAAVTRLVSQHRWTYYTAHSTHIVSSDRCLGPRRRWLARAGSMISPIESFGPRVEYYKYILCVCVFFFLRSTRTHTHIMRWLRRKKRVR